MDQGRRTWTFDLISNYIFHQYYVNTPHLENNITIFTKNKFKEFFFNYFKEGSLINYDNFNNLFDININYYYLN